MLHLRTIYFSSQSAIAVITHLKPESQGDSLELIQMMSVYSFPRGSKTIILTLWY